MLQIGQLVDGNSFEAGTVLRLGTAAQLLRFDSSDAVRSAIDAGEMSASDNCVAVEFADGIAVYPVEEVWTK